MQIRVIYISVLTLLFLSCSGCSYNDTNQSRTDSLYTELSAVRYSNISAFDSVAAELLSVTDDNNESQMVATNALAYSAMMQMDYRRSVELYRKVHESSNCEIESLVADVGLMTVCYRVSANRLFFDYRTSALSKIKRINEEYRFLSASDKERFNRAKVEFGIVSVCYFSNLAMQEETNRILEHLEKDIEEVDDITLHLYARMMIAKGNTNIHKTLSQLSMGVTMAHNKNIIWLEANYKLLLAILLRDVNVLQLFAKEFPDKITLFLPVDAELEELPYILAKEATEAFENYGDEYMMIEALAVQASCNTRLERYEASLALLSEAYGKVTDYYRNEYADSCFSNLDSLINSTDYADCFVTDANAGLYHIPECLLSICREASCAYAGLDDKLSSDVNRDIYLGLLRITRLNKHLESRISTIDEKVGKLEITAIAVLFILLTFFSFLIFVHRRRLKREKAFSAQRRKLLKVCRLLFSSLPHNIENRKQLSDAISALLNENMGDFSGNTRFFISDTSHNCEEPYLNLFDIQYVNSTEKDKLVIASEYPFDAEKKSLITTLIPYIAVAIEEGMRLSDISDEREKVEEMKSVSTIYLAEHKRENILKRVSVSILSGMRTYMDRISNEIKVLAAGVGAEDSRRKLQYVSELTEKLEDLNLILERWIKTRHGEVNLKIENFAIADLFTIIEKSKKLFESRALALIIKPTECIVKADKALTLFMINTLVDNAAKFTPSGGIISLETFDGDGFVEIAVTDTGIGLSQDDVLRILETKVYDASLIGEDNELLKPKSKGSGFGLMNCKGIIEKYKKTDSLFSVCSFNISSTKGKGSRFSFRLPKGIMRSLILLLSLLPMQMSAKENLFTKINECADSVFMSNVNGNHDNAFAVAQQALDLLNTYYKTEVGGNDTLSLFSGKAAELSWWRNSIFQDSLKENIYYNILDIRNEVAIASLALNRWDSYNYNNNIYSTLYRLVHEDKNIANHYETIQLVAKRYEAVIAFSCFLILLLIIYYIITFVRHNIIERRNEHLVLDMNNRLLNITTRSGKRSVTELAQEIVDEVYACLGETMRIQEAVISLNVIKEDKAVLARAPLASESHEQESMQMISCNRWNNRMSSDLEYSFPLYAMNGDEQISVGMLHIRTERSLNDNEVISLELVSNYLASVAHHSVTRVVCGYMALEELEEEAERMRYEENRLHIQNMVMDNCLSVIKHETVYYPSRIKDLAGQALSNVMNSKAFVTDMRELIDYYQSVFGVLCNCAIRELDGTSFKLTRVELSQLFMKAKEKAERLIHKSGSNIKVIYEETSAVVNVDIDLADYLLEQLFAAALLIKKDGILTLRTVETEDFVTVELVDNRYVLTNEEVSELFTPTRHNVESTTDINAMEYLVAKEIVRLHEDYTGKHGGRMEARSDVSGTTILFTLPK